MEPRPAAGDQSSRDSSSGSRSVAIHGGTHANPTFAGDTLYCRHVVLAREKIPGREDVGALRLRMIGAKNVDLATLPALAAGEKNDAVVLDLDYSVLIPRRQTL